MTEVNQNEVKESFQDSFEKKVSEYLEKAGLIKDNCFVFKELSELQMNAMAHQKIVKIARDIVEKGIEKDGKVSFGTTNYTYTGYEVLNSYLAVLLQAYNIAIMISVDEAKMGNYIGKNSKGIDTRYNTVELKLLISLIDCDTGWEVKYKSFAFAEGSDDKVVAKAITEALKRWEFKVFHITSKDAADIEEGNYTGSNGRISNDEINIETKPEPKPSTKQEIKNETGNKPISSNAFYDKILKYVTSGELNKTVIEMKMKDFGIKVMSELPESKQADFEYQCLMLYKEKFKK